jgi:hypothetical protein
MSRVLYTRPQPGTLRTATIVNDAFTAFGTADTLLDGNNHQQEQRENDAARRRSASCNNGFFH